MQVQTMYTFKNYLYVAHPVSCREDLSNILGAFLIKQLFQLRLLDMRWLWPTRRYPISYPTRARGIIEVTISFLTRRCFRQVLILKIHCSLSDFVQIIQQLCQRQSRSRIIMSCMTWCMISKGNHFKFANFKLLTFSDEAKTTLPALLCWPSKTSEK